MDCNKATPGVKCWGQKIPASIVSEQSGVAAALPTATALCLLPRPPLLLLLLLRSPPNSLPDPHHVAHPHAGYPLAGHVLPSDGRRDVFMPDEREVRSSRRSQVGETVLRHTDYPEVAASPEGTADNTHCDLSCPCRSCFVVLMVCLVPH